MSHTTTTFTRRFYKLKVKAKPAHVQAVFGSSGNMASRAKAKPLPPLFQISSALPVSAFAPSPWRANWKWITLPVVLGAALWAAIYFSGKSAERESRSAERRHAADQRAPAITPGFSMRPMRLSSGSRAPIGDGQRLRTDPDSANARSKSTTTGDAAEKQERQPAAYALANDGELFDAGRKLVLPGDVAGACNVGGGGVKDLGACLLQNGARAE